MAGIVWLASYPRSGNTWLRLLIADYERPDEEAVGFDVLAHYPVASSRATFDALAGVESADLTADEVDLLRPRVYARLAAESPAQRVVKVHDAYLPNVAGEPCFPAAATAGVVYAVRNPLDVAVSFAHHMGTTIATAVDLLCDGGAGLSASSQRAGPQLRERLGSWSSHVRSWVDAPQLRRLVVRYEDLCVAPAATFRDVLTFLGHAPEPVRVLLAIEHTAFARLQVREAAAGFRDAPPTRTAPFFRRGRPGGWRDALTAAQTDRLVAAHGDTMRRFGYLTEGGDPVY